MPGDYVSAIQDTRTGTVLLWITDIVSKRFPGAELTLEGEKIKLGPLDGYKIANAISSFVTQAKGATEKSVQAEFKQCLAVLAKDA